MLIKRWECKELCGQRWDLIQVYKKKNVLTCPVCLFDWYFSLPNSNLEKSYSKCPVLGKEYLSFLLLALIVVSNSRLKFLPRPALLGMLHFFFCIWNPIPQVTRQELQNLLTLPVCMFISDPWDSCGQGVAIKQCRQWSKACQFYYRIHRIKNV